MRNYENLKYWELKNLINFTIQDKTKDLSNLKNFVNKKLIEFEPEIDSCLYGIHPKYNASILYNFNSPLVFYTRFYYQQHLHIRDIIYFRINSAEFEFQNEKKENIIFNKEIMEKFVDKSIREKYINVIAITAHIFYCSQMIQIHPQIFTKSPRIRCFNKIVFTVDGFFMILVALKLMSFGFGHFSNEKLPNPPQSIGRTFYTLEQI